MGQGAVAPAEKKARQEGWSIVLIDESCFMLQPLRRRTWAPNGQTPIQYSWNRHDRLSAISALTVSPVRRRLGVHFRLRQRTISFKEAMTFLKMLHRHLVRKFILVADRLSPHRKAVRLLQAAHPDCFEVAWLSA